MNFSSQLSTFRTTAQIVQRRVRVGRFVTAWRKLDVWAVPGLLLLLVILRLLFRWQRGEWLVIGGGFVLCLALIALFTLFRRIDTAQALRLLDRRGGWKDRFSSAWDFLQRQSPSEAEQLHIARANASIGIAQQSIPEILPIPSLRWRWILPVLIIALSLTPWGRSLPDPFDRLLTQEMKDASALQSEKIQKEIERIRALPSLTEKQKQQLESLLADVKTAAESLADPKGLTAGDALESLESQARAAEKLANDLAPHSDAWASEEMLAEMARHSDTADLSQMIEDKTASGAADETEKIASTLADDTVTVDTVERYTRALERISAAATEEDRARPVGEHFGNASQKIATASSKIAAREFAELAKYFRGLAEDDELKNQINSLAENLREAGSEIGRSELKKMEEIAAARSESPVMEGLQTLNSGMENVQPMEMPGLPNPTDNAGAKPQSVPNIAEATSPTEGQEGSSGQTGNQDPAGKAPVPGEGSLMAPVPGEKPSDGIAQGSMGSGNQNSEGQSQSGMLSAPIPGTSPDDSSGASALGAANGAMSQTSQGGDQAGTGTAGMADGTSDAMKASTDSKVIAQAGKEGESTTRAVDGQLRQEQATRSQQDVIADFLSVEEQALDGQALPLSRREQVLRYFTGIREQFEKADRE